MVSVSKCETVKHTVNVLMSCLLSFSSLHIVLQFGLSLLHVIKLFVLNNDLWSTKCLVILLCSQVSQWYELVVFTASMEIYGSAVADKLDNNRNILKRRYYRQVLLWTVFIHHVLKILVISLIAPVGPLKHVLFYWCHQLVFLCLLTALYIGSR